MAPKALTVPVLLLALANGIRQWRAMREREPQRDEVQQLLALLCEQMHERLPAGRHAAAHHHQPDGGRMARGHQAMTDDIGPEWVA